MYNGVIILCSVYLALLAATISILVYIEQITGPLRTVVVILFLASGFCLLATKEAMKTYTYLRRRYSNLRQNIRTAYSTYQNASLYHLGTVITVVIFSLLFLIVSLTFVSLVLRPSLIQSIPSAELAESNIYSQSITLLLSILSVVFLVVIFLIQNANQEYPSQLSQRIFRDPYLLSVYALVLAVAMFNFTALYFGIGRPSSFFSYVFSLAVISLIFPLLMFTGHFIDISNVVTYVSDHIIDKISQANVYSKLGKYPRKDEDFLEELNSEVQVIVVTCIRAIDQGQRVVVQTCLNSLAAIFEEYIKVTRDSVGRDSFIDDFVDKYSFIVDESTDNNLRQKNLVIIADSIGDIALSVIENRDEIDQSQIVSRWLYQLRSICTESFELRRTSVAFSCIENIERVCLRTLDEGNWDDTSQYRRHIKEIGDLCAETDHHYTSQVLIRCLKAHFNMFLEISESALSGNYFTSIHSIDYLLDEYRDLFVSAKTNYSYQNFSPVIGSIRLVTDNINHQIMRLGQGEDLDAREQHHLYEIFDSYIEFIHNIIYDGQANNPSELFLEYPEALLLILSREDISERNQHELVEELTMYWTKSVDKFFRSKSHDRRTTVRDSLDGLSDYYAILFATNGANSDILEEVLTTLASTYDELFSERPLTAEEEQRRRDMHRQLKLYASWTNLSYNIENLSELAYTVLKNDVHTPDMTQGASQRLIPFMAKYGYPADDMATKEWTLEASSVYQATPHLREYVEGLLNDRENYKSFHEELIREQEKS